MPKRFLSQKFQIAAILVLLVFASLACNLPVRENAAVQMQTSQQGPDEVPFQENDEEFYNTLANYRWKVSAFSQTDARDRSFILSRIRFEGNEQMGIVKVEGESIGAGTYKLENTALDWNYLSANGCYIDFSGKAIDSSTQINGSYVMNCENGWQENGNWEALPEN